MDRIDRILQDQQVLYLAPVCVEHAVYTVYIDL